MGQSKFKLILNIRYLKAFFALFLFVFYTHAEAACSSKRYWVATDDWTLNAGLEVAKSSNSGYNNTVEFGTRMSF
tara:strand:- start:1 stop:225 length:225 start_codon:yes stop_codon:yes gene_type:complete